jgi:NTP pyrophosphatase (non-canonical NTP hydrolase)
MERASVLVRFEVDVDDDGEIVAGRARVTGAGHSLRDDAWISVGRDHIRQQAIHELAENVFSDLGADLWTGLAASYSLAEYADAASRTAVYPKVALQGGQPTGLIYSAMGLAGEAGEVAEQVKKFMRDDGGTLREERRQKLIRELGDVLWYVAAVASDLGVSLDEVAEANIAKLASRQERGVLGGSGDDR